MGIVQISLSERVGTRLQEIAKNATTSRFCIKYAVLSDKSVLLAYFMEDVYQPVIVFKHM